MIDYKPISFDEWIKLNPEVVDAEKECEECYGEGFEECYACGHEADCEYCGGAGIVNRAKDQYDRQVKRDAENWKKAQAGA